MTRGYNPFQLKFKAIIFIDLATIETRFTCPNSWHPTVSQELVETDYVETPSAIIEVIGAVGGYACQKQRNL